MSSGNQNFQAPAPAPSGAQNGQNSNFGGQINHQNLAQPATAPAPSYHVPVQNPNQMNGPNLGPSGPHGHQPGPHHGYQPSHGGPVRNYGYNHGYHYSKYYL